MANQSTDRQRMRNDLRELARLAKPGSDSPVHGFDTADSSGYVDLSAYSTSDAGWVDRELARARKGAPPPPRAGAKAIDALIPASMAPVSLETSGDPEDTMSVRPSRARGAIYTVMGLAAVAAVGFLAFTVAKHPPPAAATPDTTVAAAAPPPAAAPTTAPAATSTESTTPAAAAPAVAAIAPTTSPAPAAPVINAAPASARKKTVAAARAHAVAQAAAPAHPAAASAAVVIPRAKPAAGGGDSLMDLIKKSVATGK